MSDFKYEGRDLEAMSFAKNYHTWILSLFTPFLKGRVAEVGAGSGSFSQMILQSSSVQELVTVEPSVDMFRLLEVATRHDARAVRRNSFFGDIQSSYKDYFDAVVYVNVFEHVEQDVEEMKYVYASLRPGGHLCIFVPALPILYGKHDAAIGHFRRYTKKELHEKVVRAGFAVVSERYFDVAGVIPWFVLVRLLGRSPGVGAVSWYDKLAVPVCRILESVVSPPIGKNLVLVAKKA